MKILPDDHYFDKKIPDDRKKINLKFSGLLKIFKKHKR